MIKDGTLRVEAEVGNLARIRDFVEDTALALEVPPSAVADLVLASDEAATNIILHGYAGRHGIIEVAVSREPERAFVLLRDDAPPFDPMTVPPPELDKPLEEREPGGLGIYLIRQITDQVIHRVRPEGGNELTIIKRLKPSHGATHGASQGATHGTPERKRP